MRAVLLCLVPIVAVASAASAIVIRHDVPDAAYLENEANFPAVFAVSRSKKGGSNCVATLIKPRWAITAGHCIPGGWRPRAGTPGRPVEVGGRKTFIEEAIHHPNGDMAKAAIRDWTDVALLRLSTPVHGVAPIALYSGRDEVDQLILIPGWGVTGDGEKALSKEEDGLFRVAGNRIDSATELYLEFRFDDPRTSQRAVTREGISGPGDSGGPALVQTPNGLTIMGVSSHQNTFNGPEGRYGVVERYTSVSTVLPWIRSTMAAQAD